MRRYMPCRTVMALMKPELVLPSRGAMLTGYRGCLGCSAASPAMTQPRKQLALHAALIIAELRAEARAERAAAAFRMPTSKRPIEACSEAA